MERLGLSPFAQRSFKAAGLGLLAMVLAWTAYFDLLLNLGLPEAWAVSLSGIAATTAGLVVLRDQWRATG